MLIACATCWRAAALLHPCGADSNVIVLMRCTWNSNAMVTLGCGTCNNVMHRGLSISQSPSATGDARTHRRCRSRSLPTNAHGMPCTSWGTFANEQNSRRVPLTHAGAGSQRCHAPGTSVCFRSLPRVHLALPSKVPSSAQSLRRRRYTLDGTEIASPNSTESGPTLLSCSLLHSYPAAPQPGGLK